MENMVAMILAGGRGKRMDILCQWRPKPVLPFGGKYRVIDFGLSNCLNSGINDIAALLDYRRDDIADYLSRWHSANNPNGTLSLLQPKSGSFAGTADAVYQHLEFLDSRDEEQILVLAGDHIYKMDYQKMLAYHKSRMADVTVGVVRVPIKEVYRFGTVNVDGDGRITQFIEKSPTSRSNIASMGIYIFNRDTLAQKLIEDSRHADSPHDFGYAILPNMIDRDRVFAYEFDGYWQDIGTVDAYYQSNLELLAQKPAITLEDDWPVMGENGIASGYSLGEHGTIVNSLVSPGCVVDGYVENSILSPGVYVEEKAEVRDSLVMANAHIGYHSVLSKCVLDEEVRVGKFCYIGFGAGTLSSRSEITVVGKNVELPSNTAVGRKCKIMPNCGPAAFAARLIPSGSTVFCLEPATA